MNRTGLTLAMAVGIVALLGWLLLGAVFRSADGGDRADARAADVSVEADTSSPGGEAVPYSEAVHSRSSPHDEMATAPVWLKRLLYGPHQVSIEQADRFLAGHGRSAPHLLAASAAAFNAAYLKEAWESFPDDPAVMLRVVARPPGEILASPERRALAYQLLARDPSNEAARFWLLQAILTDTTESGAVNLAAATQVLDEAPRDGEWNELDGPTRTEAEGLFQSVGADALTARFMAINLSSRGDATPYRMSAQASRNDVPAETRAAWAKRLLDYFGDRVESARDIRERDMALKEAAGAAEKMASFDPAYVPVAKDYAARLQTGDRDAERLIRLCWVINETEASEMMERFDRDGSVAAIRWLEQLAAERVKGNVP